MMYTLEEKRDWARAGKERWEARKADLEARHLAARELGGGIPGFGGSGSQRAAQKVRSVLDSVYRAENEAEEKLNYYTHKLNYYERTIAERDRKRFTREDLIGSTWVRDGMSWRKVAKVNAKTVSVETGYSWVDRIAFEKITDYR